MLSTIGIQNVPYRDDALRRMADVTGWGTGDGRWGSEIVAILLNAGTPLVGLGLTTFIITGLILGAVGTIVVYALADGRANWLTFLLAAVFCLNPWTLSAFAFQFDGPLIALSVLFAVFSILFYNAKTLEFTIAIGVLTFITANFYQPAIGLIVTLFLTRALLDWLRGLRPARYLLRRSGMLIGAFVMGSLAYAAQSYFSAEGTRIGLDLTNPIGRLRTNLVHLIRTFISDNATSWLLFAGLTILLAIISLLSQRQRSLLPVSLALLGYLALSVLASGGVLLITTAEHIAFDARYRFPLAMGITMLAIIAAANLPQVRLYRVLTISALVVFSYLWLAPVFIFAQILAEQNDSQRFQAQVLFSDVFTLYRSGDHLVYDPKIFTDSLYLNRVAERFPIFASTFNIDSNADHTFLFPRFRLAEMVGMNPLPLEGSEIETMQARPGACNHPPEAMDPDLVIGRRWEIWRNDDQTICAIFPRVTQFEFSSVGRTIIRMPLDRVPLDPLLAERAMGASSERFQLAIWSMADPNDIQWVNAADKVDTDLIFSVEPPPAGWPGDLLVGHFFLDGTFLFQQIWPLPN